jgi:hypothetical protein
MFHSLQVLFGLLDETVHALGELVSTVGRGIREVAHPPAELPPLDWLHQIDFAGLPLCVVLAAGLTGFLVLLNYLEAAERSFQRDVRTSLVVLIAGLLIYSVTG